MLRTAQIAIVVAAFVFAVGCGKKHYEITDPQTGQVYYTEKYKATDTGAIRFKDEKSNKKVTVQNSEIEKLTKDQYESRVYHGGNNKKKMPGYSSY